MTQKGWEITLPALLRLSSTANHQARRGSGVFVGE